MCACVLCGCACVRVSHCWAAISVCMALIKDPLNKGPLCRKVTLRFTDLPVCSGNIFLPLNELGQPLYNRQMIHPMCSLYKGYTVYHE